MSNRYSAAVRCVRIFAGCIGLGFLLSLEITGVWMTAFKYSAFLLLALVAGYSFQTDYSRLSGGYTLRCVGLILAFTVILSYVLPADAPRLPMTALSVVSTVILAPVFEELFFRGAMVLFSFPFLSCVISSVVFGLFHGDGWLQATLLGLMLSYFYISSRNIAVPIICHSANNLLAFVCTLRDIRIPVFIASIVILVLVYKRSIK